MKKTKQTTAVILSVVLMLSAVLGQLPASTRAATSYGISNPVTDSNGITTWDCIWFGNYWQSNETTKEPIKWRVLSLDGDDAFLLADQNLDCQPYNAVDMGPMWDSTGATWETCSLRTWLNSTFYQNAFNSAEQAAIRTTAVVNEDNPSYGTEGGNNTQDKVYLLSIAEACNAAYGFNSKFNEDSETRYSKNTEYAKARGAYTDTSDSSAGNGGWWLRSPGNDSRNAALVMHDFIYGGYHGDIAHNGTYAVRPALHIDLSSSTWRKVGIVSSGGGNVNLDKTENLHGINGPVINGNGVTTWDCIWFGNYWQSNETTKEPIKWRVLSVDGDDAFLLADQNLDCKPYNTEIYEDVTWETCSLRTWLNGDFYQNAFTLEEQTAIRNTMVLNQNNPYYNTGGGNGTKDKIYLLSFAEASNAAYGFNSRFEKNSETRVATNTTFVTNANKDMGNSGEAAIWWLRTPGSSSDSASYVNKEGYGYIYGGYSNELSNSVRPALHIDLSSSTWSKAGIVSSGGGNVNPDRTENPYGINGPVINGNGLNHNVTTWDCIWFGNYWQSSETTKDPIKWRVLSVDGDDAFLLADQNLDCRPYNTTSTEVTWENSCLRTWLNGDFFQTAFNETERAAIRITSVVNDEHPYDDDTSGGNNTLDKIYLLSIAEASNDDYGFDTWLNRESKTRVAVNSVHVKNIDSDCRYWWLRSPGFYSGMIADVNSVGCGNSLGGSNCINNLAVRPALHIDLSSSTWSKAGTVSSSGDSTNDDIPTATPSPSPSGENGSSADNDKKDPPNETKKPSDTTTLPENADSTGTEVVPPSRNTRVKDNTGVTYTVTKADMGKGEVAYTAPKNTKVTSITVPAKVKIKGMIYKVTSIQSRAFTKCKKLKKVTIGNNIKIIGKKAFYGCAKLKKITIKTTKLADKTVGSKAFAKIHSKVNVKVPKSKLTAYKKILKKKGITGKNQKIKK